MWLMLGVTVRRRDSVAQECAFCGYSLAGIDEPVCPECGRTRRLAKERNTAGTVSHIISVAVAASVVSILAIMLAPQFIVQESRGIMGTGLTNSTSSSFLGSRQMWRFPPREETPALEPDRIRFSHNSGNLVVVRDSSGLGWIDERNGSPIDAARIAASLGDPYIEPAIAEILSESWVTGSMVPSSLSSATLMSGRPFAVVQGRSSSMSESPLPTVGLLLTTWGLALWRIWTLFR